MWVLLFILIGTHSILCQLAQGAKSGRSDLQTEPQVFHVFHRNIPRLDSLKMSDEAEKDLRSDPEENRQQSQVSRKKPFWVHWVVYSATMFCASSVSGMNE